MDDAKCQLCGEPMPENEQMFTYHGYSGPCPKPPLPRQPSPLERLVEEWQAIAAMQREEAVRIRKTIKAFTDAEARCIIRAEVWEQCAVDLIAALAAGK